MTSDTPTDGRCNAKTTDGGYCENWPVDGADRCRMHGGTNDGPTNPEALAGNQNAARHQIHADPANVLDDLAETDPEAYEWIERKHDSYLADAPFGPGTAKADELKQICVQEYIIWKATGFQLEGGVVVKMNGGDGSEVGDRITENPVNLPLDRLQRTVTKRLDKLGVLDSPESQQAHAEAGKAQLLREMMTDIDEYTDDESDAEPEAADGE